MFILGFEISNHAFDRAMERNISLKTIENILTNGDWKHDLEKDRVIFFIEGSNIELVSLTRRKLLVTIQRRKRR